MSLRRSMIFSTGYALPLDQVNSTPLVAYGFRKLKNSYAGSCLRAQTRTAITGTCVQNTNTITNIPSGKTTLLYAGMFVYVYDGNTDRSTSSTGIIRTITNVNTGTNTITLSGNIANSGGTYTGNLYFAYDIGFNQSNEFDPLDTNLIRLKDLDTNGDVSCRILYDQSGNNRYLSLRLGVQSITFTNTQALNDLPHIYKSGSYSTNSGKFCLQPVTTPTNAAYPSQLQVYVSDSTSNSDNFFNNSTKGITAITKLVTTFSNSTSNFNIFAQTNLTRSTTQRAYDGTTYGTTCAAGAAVSWYGFRMYYIAGPPSDLALVPTMRMAVSPYQSCANTTYPFGTPPAGTLDERFRSITSTEITNSWNNGKSIFSFIDYETTSSPIATFSTYTTTSYGRGYYNGSAGAISYHLYPRTTFNVSGSNPFMNHEVQELIIFDNSNHTDGTYVGSSERSIIEKNMGRYYNVNVI